MLYPRKGGAGMEERWYAAIDLKSFYASVECVERGLDYDILTTDYPRHAVELVKKKAFLLPNKQNR